MALETLELTVGDLTFPCLAQGSGPLVLMIHGFPDEPHTFRHQFNAFADAGYRVVAPTLRGYHPSNLPSDGCYQVAASARDMLGILDALGADKAAVYGHDWGSAIASAMAVLAPDRLTHLITSAVPYGPAMAAAFVTNPEQQRRSWYMFFFQMPFAEAAVAHNDFAFIDRIWSDWSPTWDAPAEALAGVKQVLAQDGVLLASLGYYRATLGGVGHSPAFDADNAKLGSPITVPAMHLQGDVDGCIGPELTDGMAEHFTAGLELHVLENVGHFVHQEVPDRFNQLALDFIAR